MRGFQGKQDSRIVRLDWVTEAKEFRLTGRKETVLVDALSGSQRTRSAGLQYGR